MGGKFVLDSLIFISLSEKSWRKRYSEKYGSRAARGRAEMDLLPRQSSK